MNNLADLLPDDVSDEVAYHMANFMMELSLAVETRYYEQMKRYAKENSIEPFPYNLLTKETSL